MEPPLTDATPVSPLNLPPTPAPIGAYERGVFHNGVGCLSGQFPLVDGRIVHPGRLGLELNFEQGQEAAKAAALNVLAQLEAVLGEWDRLKGLLRVDAVLACSNDFNALPQVVDSASQTFLHYLGDRGRHARSLLPTRRLPLNASIELIVTFAVH